ncbi:MAG: 2,5-diamino-6-(ribosylamino)-4(3H)-pyrimidinone 5'-phosphate reductase [Methanomassiliicoccales archaeon]|nr:2,5-diamino-6-(ribosylamino)-4(3H)-pyrimidinone 5'-phosphate reductase [Methanomassiliicoccales archaeon]
MRPYVIVNCAMTPDGKIAGRERRQVRISSQEDLERVKKLRASCDAILVGIGTVLADDPHLTVKDLPPEKNPLRVVLDSNGRTPDHAKVLDRNAPTLIATSEECKKTWKNVEVVRFGKGRVDIEQLLSYLYSKGVRKLLVEGGGEVIWSFFNRGFIDRYCVYIGDFVLGGRDAPTPVEGDGFSDHLPFHLKLISVERLGGGVLLIYEAVRNVK